MFARNLLTFSVTVLMLFVSASFADAGEIYIDRFTFTEDDTAQYFSVFPGGGVWDDYLRIEAVSSGNQWATVDVMEFTGRPGSYRMVRSSRYVPGDGGEVFHRLTASNDGFPNVGLRTWGGAAPAEFDVYQVTGIPVVETPWEDWWYTDPGNPDTPGPGGIVLDVGSDVEHPYTYVEGSYFSSKLNVRRFACSGGAIERVEFDLTIWGPVSIIGYEVLPPFSDMEMQVTGVNTRHVSIWADSPVSIDPVYACEFDLDPPTWAMITLDNCVFTDAGGGAYSGECFAPLRINWGLHLTRTESSTWGSIKAMYK